MYYQRRMALAALPSAAYWARRHLETTLTDWRATIDVPSAKLIVTELMSNGVKFSTPLTAHHQVVYGQRPGAVPYDALAQIGYVGLRLSYASERLLIEVWDRSERPPLRIAPDREAEGGRGLLMVERLALRWGWYPSSWRGKVVWAEMGE